MFIFTWVALAIFCRLRDDDGKRLSSSKLVFDLTDVKDLDEMLLNDNDEMSLNDKDEVLLNDKEEVT